MKGIKQILLGLILTVTLASLVASQSEVEYELQNFLGLTSPSQILGNFADYDLYVLSIQWGNTLCRDSAMCKTKIKSVPQNTFTLHGLWPSLSSGAMLQDCNTGADIKIQEDSSSLFSEMDLKWLSYTTDNIHFWTHEFNKHGYCYTHKYNYSDYKVFFRYALDLFEKYSLEGLMRKALGDLHGEHAFSLVDLTTHLQQAAGGLDFDLDCVSKDGVQLLAEIRFVFDLTLAPYAGYPRKTDCKSGMPITVIFQ